MNCPLKKNPYNFFDSEYSISFAQENKKYDMTWWHHYKGVAFG